MRDSGIFIYSVVVKSNSKLIVCVVVLNGGEVGRLDINHGI